MSRVKLEVAHSPNTDLPLYKEYPLNLDIPIFVGLLLGVGVFSLLLRSTKVVNLEVSETNLPPADDEKSRSALNSAGVVGENLTPNSRLSTPNSQLPFYDWDNIVQEAVGILIAGNSGSAKTSLATYLLGKLTQHKPAQVIALDPHANRNKLWEELGVPTISSFSLIEKQLELLEKLLDKRRKQSENGDTVIAVAEELGACIKNFSNPKRVQVTLERLGGEGRKYGIIFISINTSANAEDIEISAQSRNNYITILCGAAARSFAENKWKKTDERQSWINDQAYPCLVTGAVPHAIATHPTHGHHQEFATTGKEPKNILPVNQLSITIPLATDNKPPDISSEAQRLLEWFNKKTDNNNKAFEIRKIQQSRPLGKNSSHKLETLTPLIEELLQAELIEKDNEQNYSLAQKVAC